MNIHKNVVEYQHIQQENLDKIAAEIRIVYRIKRK